MKDSVVKFNCNMKVAVIGHREMVTTERLKSLLNGLILDLIGEGADTFCFANKGWFNDLCYDMVTELKSEYDLKRVYVRAEYASISNQYANYILNLFEETYFDDRVRLAGVGAYVKRNEIMIDTCDVLLTYYDKDYVPSYRRATKKGYIPPKRRSGTAKAVDYALRKQKKVINVLDLLKIYN